MLKVYWSPDPKPGNFGDILTPHLLDYFKIQYQYSKKEFDTLCIGSIISKAKKDTTVLGSGIISKNDVVTPLANYKFVRGPHTRKKVIDTGGICPEIYGDPAMLLPLICKESRKEHELGIIPHYVDYDKVKQEYPNVKVINLLNSNPLEVCKEITSCKKIISSSLHGVITAHAYEIPAAWVKFSNNLAGDDIKFYDHFASVGLDAKISTYNNPKFSLPKKFNTDKIKNIFMELSNT